MAVNENDVELLHEYVDGELPVAECEGLWRRLAIERELMGELDRLRADHCGAGQWFGTAWSRRNRPSRDWKRRSCERRGARI